jgi:hypothetical protein
MMVHQVGFGNQGSDLLEPGEDGCLFPVGMPYQDLVEEPESLDGGGKTPLSPCHVQGCSIDTLHVIPEGIVKGEDHIDRLGHDAPSPVRV